MEAPASGGDELDPFPTEVDPLDDYVSALGLAAKGQDSTLLDLNGSNEWQWKDAVQTSPFLFNELVKNFGTPANSLLASVQATANSAKVLVKASNTDQIFTGTTAGQILRFPVATTLQVGHRFEVWNFSTQNIAIQDAGSNLLTTLKPNARTTCVLRDASTSNGVWGLSYGLDNGNVFGTQLYYQEALAETSTNSTTTFLNKVTLTTPSLPLGDYICQFQFIWRAANASRSLDVRVQRAASNIQAWRPFTANLADRQLLSGFARNVAISGAQTFTLDFKVSGTATTVYMQQAKLFVWRVA